MNKNEFLAKLAIKLKGLPDENIKESLLFYSEMIDDRVEDGTDEQDAICELGSIDDIACQIITDIPVSTLVKEKIKSNRALTAWEIVLLILGSPIWLSILIAIFAVILSIYISFWVVIISLWAVEVSFIACSLAGFLLAIYFIPNSNILTGVASISAGLLLAGLSIFFFFLCKLCTKGLIILTKKIAFDIKSLFIRQESSK